MNSDIDLKAARFHSAIESLQGRSRRCRRNVWVLSAILMLAFALMFFLVFSSLTRQSLTVLGDTGRNSAIFGYTDPYVAAKEKLADTIWRNGVPRETTAAGEEIDRMVSVLEKLSNLRIAQGTFIAGDSILVPVLTTIILSAGLIGAIIFFVNICVSFIRYNAQLAELYDSHAESLKLAQGDPNSIAIFTEVLSPMIVSIGAVPISSYEKVLDLAKASITRNSPK